MGHVEKAWDKVAVIRMNRYCSLLKLLFGVRFLFFPMFLDWERLCFCGLEQRPLPPSVIVSNAKQSCGPQVAYVHLCNEHLVIVVG